MSKYSFGLAFFFVLGSIFSLFFCVGCEHPTDNNSSEVIMERKEKVQSELSEEERTLGSDTESKYPTIIYEIIEDTSVLRENNSDTISLDFAGGFLADSVHAWLDVGPHKSTLVTTDNRLGLARTIGFYSKKASGLFIGVGGSEQPMAYIRNIRNYRCVIVDYYRSENKVRIELKNWEPLYR